MPEIPSSPIQPPVQAFGLPRPHGAYVLVIGVTEELSVHFGKFLGGRPITVPAGNYLYIGSAMGRCGATSLPWRLLRHAIRGVARPPQPVWPQLVPCLKRLGLSEDKLCPQRNKTLRWNVDHLLDHAEAHLLGALLFCSDVRLEQQVARALESDRATHALVRGLGAHDSPGATHLLRVGAGPGWWCGLPKWLAEKLGLARDESCNEICPVR